MKNLKKLMVVAAAMSAMHFAKAEEKVFAPTDYEGGEIDKIELVNGQLLVRSNGKINGQETPFVYVGTNTQHFAENGFAQGGLTNVAQYVHVGEGTIYMTENGNTTNVWKTTVSSKQALNGVTQKIEKLDATNDVTTLKMSTYPLVKVFDGVAYHVTDNGIYNGGTAAFMNLTGKTAEDFVLVPKSTDPSKKYGYVLASDAEGHKKVYSNASGFTSGVKADSITLADDKKHVVITVGSTMNVYDGSTGNLEYTKDATSLSINSPIKSVVVAGNTMYYATAKKLGYTHIME